MVDVSAPAPKVVTSEQPRTAITGVVIRLPGADHAPARSIDHRPEGER